MYFNRFKDKINLPYKHINQAEFALYKSHLQPQSEFPHEFSV